MYFENRYSLNTNLGELANRLSSNSSGYMESYTSEKPMPAIKRSSAVDDDNGELVNNGSRTTGKKTGISEAKMMAALKSHSEAERRRRERINAHLESLRGLVPSKSKMDKATLLSEVVTQVKKLKTTAEQAAEGMHIPTDTDSVEVEILENDVVDGSFLLRASICCDHRPELLSELRRSVGDLRVRVLKCEISTLGGRLKCVFLLTISEGKIGDVVSSVHACFSDVLDKVTASAEIDQPLFFPRKRRRVSY